MILSREILRKEVDNSQGSSAERISAVPPWREGAAGVREVFLLRRPAWGILEEGMLPVPGKRKTAVSCLV